MKHFIRAQLLAAAFCGFAAMPTAAFELTAAHVNPAGEPSNVAFAELAERLKDSKTGLSMLVFPQGQVGDEKDAIEQTLLGAISMTTVSTSNLSAFAPSAGVFDIPFLFNESAVQPWQVADGPIGTEIKAKIEAESGLKVLGWWSGGMRHAFTRNVDIKAAADLDNLKIRVIGSPVYIDTFNGLGAKATPMPYGEVYTALATGTIDAAENDTSGYRNMRFYEQAPHFSLTGHFFLYKVVVMQPAIFESMSDEQRAEFLEIFEDVTKRQRKLFDENFAADIAFMKENKVTVTEPDRASLIEAARPVIEKYEGVFGADLVDRIRNTR
ncbi:TRAP transporter substrate-binding protein [Arvimicrobium flavum]|uniref:TRAP transporter substrate-binding protein n=1 Tax=Arvimicrobium flavum TaxID=3393320 RepID=UPI00237B74D8|nr:TRAP transporter substrate-binding protein [Mesorhizobium shangrilense]